jgi:hypothetical protein
MDWGQAGHRCHDTSGSSIGRSIGTSGRNIGTPHKSTGTSHMSIGTSNKSIGTSGRQPHLVMYSSGAISILFKCDLVTADHGLPYLLFLSASGRTSSDRKKYIANAGFSYKIQQKKYNFCHSTAEVLRNSRYFCLFEFFAKNAWLYHQKSFPN